MALSISDILQVSAHTVMVLEKKPYKLSKTIDLRGEYYAMLRNPATKSYVPLWWSDADEERAKGENKKIKFVRDLLVNGIQTMDGLVAYQNEKTS